MYGIMDTYAQRYAHHAPISSIFLTITMFFFSFSHLYLYILRSFISEIVDFNSFMQIERLYVAAMLKKELSYTDEQYWRSFVSKFTELVSSNNIHPNTPHLKSFFFFF